MISGSDVMTKGCTPLPTLPTLHAIITITAGSQKHAMIDDRALLTYGIHIVWHFHLCLFDENRYGTEI